MIYNSKPILTALLWSFMDMRRAAKNLSCLPCLFSAEVEQGDALPSCFSSHNVNKCSFCGLFSVCHVFCIFVLFVGDFAIKDSLQRSAEVLSSVPKCKKAVTCLMKKIHVLDKLHSGKRWPFVGREFNVIDINIYIYIYFFLFICIFGCVGSSFLCEGFP